jgi:predicted dehydrogenase
MINIGQVGIGYWGPNLLRNLSMNSRCRIHMVADASEERRDFVAANYASLKTVAYADQVINASEIHAVVISTPAHTHYALATAALAAGKHVLVEKPMATSVAEVEEIGRLAAGRGLVAMVGHTFLFNPAVRHLKQLIDSGSLGDVRYIYSQRLNLGRIRSDVDALWNLAPHDISIIQYLLDDRAPASVRRKGMDFIQKGIEDVVFLDIEYPGKVLAHVHVSWLDPHKVRSLTVVGSKKMAVYNDMAEHKVAIYDKGIEPKAVLGESMDYDQIQPPSFVHRSGDIHFPAIAWKEPLRAEIDHFLDCIEGRALCITGPAHAKEVVRILAEAKAN